MRAFGAVSLLCAALLLLFGCTGSGGANGNAFATNVTFTDSSGVAVATLPAAYSGQFYSADIFPTAGKAPFSCDMVQGAGLPGTIDFNPGTCTLAGQAPILSGGTSKGEYPFGFYISVYVNTKPHW